MSNVMLKKTTLINPSKTLLCLFASLFILVSLSLATQIVNASDKYSGGSGSANGGTTNTTINNGIQRTTISVTRGNTTYKTSFTFDQNTGQTTSFSTNAYSNDDRNAGGGGGTVTVQCLEDPNVVPEDIYFQQTSDPSVVVNQNDLELGVQYTPYLRVVNRGCLPTNSATTSLTGSQSGSGGGTGLFGWYGSRNNTSAAPTELTTVYADYPPYGQNGTFPVALRIDFNTDGTFEYTEVVNAVGPLSPAASGVASRFSALGSASTEGIAVPFPPFTLTEAGQSQVVGFVDITSDNPRFGGAGCGGDWGCIREAGTPASNRRTETIAAVAPSISLGSFKSYLHPNGIRINPYDVRTTDRDLGDDTSAMDLYYTGAPGLTVNEIGLYWSGIKVSYPSCTGSTITSDGSTLSDFDGQRDADTGWQRYYYTDFTVGQYNDVFITEPTSGNWHFYTVTCDTTGGGQVSDSVLINNGGDVTDLMLLQPTLYNIGVPTGATLAGSPFTITNQSSNDAVDYTYTFSIDGTEVDTGLLSGPLVAGDSEVQTATFDYTAPDTIAIVPMEVCITHADMSVPACSSAQVNVFEGVTECSDSLDNDLDSLIDASDPGCWTDPTDPTTYDASDETEANLPPVITATPGIVRQGDTFLLEWDPQGNVGCALSANAVADGSVAGSLTITAQTQSTYTITCVGDQSASVRVQVIPNIFET